MYNNFSKPLTLRPKATLPLGHLDLDFLSHLRRNWPPLADACLNALASCGVFCGGWRRTWHWRETRSSRTLLGHRWGSERCRGEREPASETDTERVSWKPQQNITGEIRKLTVIQTDLKILILLHEERLSVISQLHMQAHRLSIDLNIHLWRDEYSAYMSWTRSSMS